MKKLLFIALFLITGLGQCPDDSKADSICVDCEPLAQEINTSVTAFGAAGDGVTNDQAAIQAAIDSLPSNGGTVYFPPGNYKINTSIVCDMAGVKLVGNGVNNSIITLGSTSQHGIRITADRCEIHDLLIDPPASYTKSAIRIEDGVNETLIERIRILGNDYTAGGKGIEFVTSIGDGITFNTVKDSDIELLQRSIELNQAFAGSWINGNRFINNRINLPKTGFYMTGTSNDTDGNVFIGNQIQTDANLTEVFRVDGSYNMLTDNMFWDLNISGNKGINVLSTAANTQITGSYLLSSNITDVGVATQISLTTINKLQSPVDVVGAEAGDASLQIKADEGDDTPDTWILKALAAGGLSIIQGSTTQLSISSAGLLTPTGVINAPDGANNAAAYSFTSDTDLGVYRMGSNNLGVTANNLAILSIQAASLRIRSDGSFCFATSTADGTVCDTWIKRDAANVLALRNVVSPTTAQIFRVYNTDSTDDEYLELGFDTNVMVLRAVKTGSATLRNLTITGAEVTISPISGDGNGKAVCIKSDGTLGTCTDVVGVTGTCTCS